MKRLFIVCLLSCLVSPFALMAQDIIIKKNADEIEAVVKEIGINTVTYKKYSNPNGPDYQISKSEIFMIRYANGEKEVFSESNRQTTSDAQVPNLQSSLEKERLDSLKLVQASIREKEYREKFGSIILR